ncbi:MAG: hypothetical protein KatS3mg051_1091 [Anaerolineae bacterium]|nr:MAG: hypothetical protein KatS3mg051_1091 [Anaerolineae bacterium]
MNLDAIALAAINDAGGQEHIDSLDDQARAEAINRLARDLAREHGVSLDVARRAVGKALARERGRAVRLANSGWGGPRPGAGSGGPRPNTGPLPRFLRWEPFSAGEKGASAMSAADITLYRCNGCGAWAWEPYVEAVHGHGENEVVEVHHPGQPFEHRPGCPMAETGK